MDKSQSSSPPSARPVVWVTPEGSGDFESASDDIEGEGIGNSRKRRKRQVLSCSECKRRKINQPCGPCAKRGDGDKCEWTVPEKSPEWVSRAEFRKLEHKVARLESLLKQALESGQHYPMQQHLQHGHYYPHGHGPNSPPPMHPESSPEMMPQVRLPPLSTIVPMQREIMDPHYATPIPSRGGGGMPGHAPPHRPPTRSGHLPAPGNPRGRDGRINWEGYGHGDGT
ncbi:hypothetical protein DL96DRAFT_1713216 [Flagelloscypha sp. PMI_526]|nr:hypothetical protein DL96DRAFT_1713216 [Flagelloscypha sp. PMI_526]